LLQDENEAIAEAFLAANADFSLVPANEVLAQQQIKVDTGKYLKLLPHLHGTDGFFAAVFERKAEVKKSIVDLSNTAEGKATEPEANIHAAAGASKKKSVKPEAEKPVKLEAVKPKAVKAKVAKDKVVKVKVSKAKV
jgi:16S rRNA (cytosine967-C5)-methyltransferase